MSYEATQINFDRHTSDQILRIRTDEGVELVGLFYLFAGHDLTLIAVGEGQDTHWEIQQAN